MKNNLLKITKNVSFLKWCLNVTISAKIRRSCLVASCSYIWCSQNSKFSLPQNFISQNHRRDITYSNGYSLNCQSNVPGVRESWPNWSMRK